MIYQARGQILDIKIQKKKWKLEYKLCSGCYLEEESGEEILNCKSFGGNSEKLLYSMFFSDLLSEQLRVGKAIKDKLKLRKKRRSYLKLLEDKNIGQRHLPSARFSWALVECIYCLFTCTDKIYIYIGISEPHTLDEVCAKWDTLLCIWLL